MLTIISDAIHEFYVKKNYALFQALCMSSLHLLEELTAYVKSKKLVLDDSNDTNEPSKDWDIYFSEYKKGEFKISYKTVLSMCKVAPVFHIQHEFKIENKDEKRMSSVLDGFGNQPYTKEQLELEQKICDVLYAKKYQRLSDFDLEEVVEGFKMPSDVAIFGFQVTVEHLLFRDIFCICGDD